MTKTTEIGYKHLKRIIESIPRDNFRGVHGGRWKKSSEEEFFENISFMRRNHYRKYVEILFKLLLNYP